ncbi:MAG: hypothetical protein DWP95_07550 [Proteobacteria bacterium]|nr:MAG: hypothetical protein DWP95_07550 [Pseudomonadota bacterium]
MNKAGHIHIYYSARVNVLVEALNQNIKNHYHDHQDPLKPLSVIVPNGHIQKYLNLRLTEINGISANIQYPFLETGLYDAALSLYPANQKPQQLTVDQIELAIWGFLGDTNHQKTPSLSPLFDYLKPHENTALRAQKRWQLAQQLALLFIDYELSRPEMIDAWLAHQLFYANSQNERLKQVEMAQRTVYQAIFDQTSNQCTLSGLLRQLKSPQAIEVQPLLLFVPSRLTPLHRRIILLVAQHYPVHIYHLNVCREFWLDMETDAEINWRQRIQQLHLNATDETGQTIKTADNHNAGQLTGEAFFDLEQGLSALENPLLKAWGKPGRETLRLLSDLENDAIHAGVPYQDDLLDEHPDNQTKTAQCTLSALQQGILDRIPHDRNHRNLDNTLQVANAPSIEAEVTHVYNGILYELQQNPSLQLTDIAVLVTDMTAYRYVIEQVFERLNLHARSPLRYSISDSNAGEESLYARAVIQLLTILETDFIRDEVFEWLANPCVMTALNSHQHEVDAWLQAAVDLGIYRGFKQLYKAPDEDTAILFTWQQGLQRLHRSLVQADADNSPLGRHELGRLSVIMTQLYAFQSQLKEQLSGEQWQQTLQTMFDTFIAISDEHPQEDAVALAVTRHLQQLVDSRAQLALSFADIKQYLLSRLQTISAGRGRYLSGGVVCAALQPMRPVPFKISFIMGLGESQFPGQSRQNTLDLASYSRRIGDTDQVDNHKYLFLETVMSTEQKLFLSYVGRDEQTGDPLATSVVVNDVMDWLKKHTENHLKPLILPLSPADVFKQSAQQKSAVMHNFLLSDYLLYHHKIQPGKAILETDIKDITQSQKQLLQQFNGVFHPGEVSAIDDSLAESPGPVDSRDLANYLINPTETVFAQQGGVLTRIEDTELLSDEPISLNPLDRHNIVSRAVERDLGLH